MAHLCVQYKIPMKDDLNQSLLELILPEGILDHFEITGFEKGESGKYVYDKTLTIHLEEKRIKYQKSTRLIDIKRVVLWKPARSMTIPSVIC